MVQGHDADDDREQDKGNESVREEPEGLTAKVAEGLIVRDVSIVRHTDVQAKVSPNGCWTDHFLLRLSCHVLVD